MAARTRRCRFLLAAIASLSCMAWTVLAQNTTSKVPASESILQFLQETINWYHQIDAQRQMAAEPGDFLLLSDNQQLATQVVGLAFDFARAEADIIAQGNRPSHSQNAGAGDTQYESLFGLLDSLDQEIRHTRGEVEGLRQQLSTAEGRRHDALQVQISEVQSELNLAEARRDTLRSMVEFVKGPGTGGMGVAGLREDIEALARAVPAASAKAVTGREGTPAASGQITPPAGATWRAEPAGVWGLLSDLFALSRKSSALRSMIRMTDSLNQSSKELRKPLTEKLRQMIKSGDELAKQADSADPAELAREKKELDGLTSEFKRSSATILPLSKLGILLDLYQKNIAGWQETVDSRYSSELKSLLIRLAFLVVVLGTAFGLAELWRRAIVRYVRDTRRRHQFLLLRKIVLWCVIALVLVFSFASELGSVATFAGLMTAGVAVALQNVLLSAVGYFFLIGKFGIRVGDLVQVAGVTGEVVEIGLVRFHLLELVRGEGKTPSGRVVAFSNSIVFQSTAGLFKQVPGTNFVWHEITLTLTAEGDYRSAEQRLRGAVEAVFSEYRGDMERQHRQMERTLTATPVSALKPTSELRITPSGLEIALRYPVDLQNAAEVDDRVTRRLLEAIDHEPKLKMSGSSAGGSSVKEDISSGHNG